MLPRTDKSEKEVDKTYKDGKEEGASNERVRLMSLLIKEQSGLVEDYKNTIRHTGGLLTKSMVFAYSKGIQDTFKLLTKKEEDEKPVQTK